jgi:tetratricopeptide (TPR) repeat protein
MVCLGQAPAIASAGGLDLELARKLIVEGSSAEAYSLLEPYEFEQAGNTNFDYLLGLAALNSSQAGKASLIFERVLAADPLYAAARLDLGRAYFLLGDYNRARTEFTRAQALNPPPSALAVIRRHLSEIEILSNRLPTRLRGYFEAGVGYNNNINNSTSQIQISVPVLLNTQFALSTANVKTPDSYLGLAVGGEVVHPVSSDWSMYAGMDIRSRNDMKYSNFDFLALDARVGAMFYKNAEQIKGGLIAGQFGLGRAVNHKSSGFDLEWGHAYSNASQTVLFVQYILYRYPDLALASNNIDQTIAGLGWVHTFADNRANVSGSIFGGNERDTNLRIDGGKSIRGVRFSGQAALGERLDMFASGGVQWGKYDRTNNAFLVIRDDHQTDLTIGLNYRNIPNWTLRPQITLSQIQSNIVVNRYNQTDFSLTLRRDFK